MKRRMTENSISAIMALCILAVFAVTILGVLLGGAKVYKSITRQGQTDFDSRTCQQLLLTKLRQASSPNAVQIRQFGSGDAIYIYENYESRSFVTRIYCYNGWLMELFSVDSDEFSPEDGEKLLPLDALTVTQQDNLLVLTLSSQSQTYRLYHTVRGDGYEE